MTVIGPAVEQVDYRLQESAGCGLAHGREPGAEHAQGAAQVDYRMAEERLTWFGGGLAEVGIRAGTPLSGEADKARARALMDGADPRTGEALVTPKRAAHPKSKLATAPFLAALESAAAGRGVPVEQLPPSAWGRTRVAELTRMVARDGDAHRTAVKDLERLAGAVGVDLAGVYAPEDLAVARAHRTRTVRTGERGVDITIDIPKSPSVVWALADPATAEQLQGAFRDAVTETLADVERWCGYGMRGKAGTRAAHRIDTSGLLGWVMWHDVARPVRGQTPDPHLHAHAVIAHMVKGVDGRWSTPANGTQEFHRHVETIGALAQARFRAKTAALGFRWERTPGSRVWELAGVPPRVRDLYSKRAAQTSGMLTRLGIDPGEATTAQIKAASALCREGKDTAPSPAPSVPAADELQDVLPEPVQLALQIPVDGSAAADGPDAHLRESWRAQAEDAGLDAAAIVAAARGDGPDGPVPDGPSRPGPDGPSWTPPVLSVREIADAVFHPETGLTAHTKVVTRPKLLAAVLDELPAGVHDVAQAEAIADAVIALEDGPAVQLRDVGERGPVHRTHPERYTSRDILAAENTALVATELGRTAGLAVVPADTVAMAISEFEVGAGFALSAEQRAVVERLTTTGMGVDAVIGVAGSGKTTLMSAARTAWQAAGYTVAGATTAAVAAQALSAEAGIASQTIASLLKAIDDPQRDGLAGVDVLVLDEAAMVDDREAARLLTAAFHADTKVVMIGDPVQLRAIGVGGTFAAARQAVDGLTLTENRRQRHAVERAALERWRENDRDGALRDWAASGRVHVGDGRDDTLAGLLTDWAQTRTNTTFADAHEELKALLVLAGTNADVDALNAGARAIRRELGEVTGPDRHYRLAGGGVLALAVGDHVRVRRNDYRTRHKDATPEDVDVLNGYRGLVVGFDGRDPVVEWRRQGPDGPVTETATLTAAQVARGELTHGTAMTVAAAQGQSGERTWVYGMGLDPHALYPAMSRDKARVDLYLPLALLESDADRIRHGAVINEADALTRAITAYANSLAGDRADKLVTPEVAADAPAVELAPPRPRPPVGEVAPWYQRKQRPFGDRTDAELTELRARYQDLLRFQAATVPRIEAELARAAAGDGPTATRLTARRAVLTAAATAAAELERLTAAIAKDRARQDELHDAQRAAQAQADRNPLALRLAGTSRRAARADVQAAEDALADVGETIAAALARKAELQAVIRAPYEAGAPTVTRLPSMESGRYNGWQSRGAVAELDHVTSRWEQHHAAAVAFDRATAPTRTIEAIEIERFGEEAAQARAHVRVTRGIRDEPPTRQDLDRTRRRLTDVTAEIAVRARLTPEQADTERDHRDRVRARRAAEKAEQQAAQKAARDAARNRRPSVGYEPYRHHGPRLDGPSRGFGR